MNAPPTTLSMVASRYRVIKELGRGGMGVVYIVEHVHTGDQLALKLMLNQSSASLQAVERFRREARASARIKSDHVVRVIDADVAPELDGAPFLVMELLDGTDLQKRLNAEGRLPPAEVIGWLGQVARGLDKAHAMGIVHRDLKPENVFLHRREDGSQIVKILDFGISKFGDSPAGGAGQIAGASLTATGDVMGTPLYMAPEQARGLVDAIAPTTDVWALGLISLQLLTGDIYWTATTMAELMVAILVEPMPPPTSRWPWLPRGIDAWFARSCAREPSQRFPSVGEQVTTLAALFQGSVHVPPPPHSQPAIQATMPLATTPFPSSHHQQQPPVGAATTTRGTAQDAATAATSGSGAPKSRSLAPFFAVFGILAAVGIVGGVPAVRRFVTRTPPTSVASERDSAVVAAPVVSEPSTTPPPAASELPPSATVSASASTSAAASIGRNVRIVPPPPPPSPRGEKPADSAPKPTPTKPFSPTSL